MIFDQLNVILREFFQNLRLFFFFKPQKCPVCKYITLFTLSNLTFEIRPVIQFAHHFFFVNQIIFKINGPKIPKVPINSNSQVFPSKKKTLTFHSPFSFYVLRLGHLHCLPAEVPKIVRNSSSPLLFLYNFKLILDKIFN